MQRRRKIPPFIETLLALDVGLVSPGLDSIKCVCEVINTDSSLVGITAGLTLFTSSFTFSECLYLSNLSSSLS